MLYIFARRSFKALLAILTLIIIPLVIAWIPSVYQKPFISSYGPLVAGVFIFLLVLTGIITAIGEHHSREQTLKRYLCHIEDTNYAQTLVGFAQQSTLISPRVPLDDTFIHLHAVMDRPCFDWPTEQLKQMEELRLRTDLTPEQREEALQPMHVVWHSQRGQNISDTRQPQEINVEYVMKQLTAKQPGAVILGPPGSGKSTTLRWLAYHMARSSRLTGWRHRLNSLLWLLGHTVQRYQKLGYVLPDGLAPAQIPILIRISDYAKALSKPENEMQPFQQFLVDYFKRLNPEQPKLGELLLDKLEQGHCLILMDGLDEIEDKEAWRCVTEHITTFVTHYSPTRKNTRHFNRFIITSRIVGYEGEKFTKYSHYTLQYLKDEQIAQFLECWCPAVERYQKMFTQETKILTTQQKIQADKEGLEQKEYLWEALQHNPNIKQLAVNPLMLTILAMIQRSGKTLPHRRIELFQIVTLTLLDNWNQEKGCSVFLAEEMSLVEEILGLLAYQIHSSNLFLTETRLKEIVSGKMNGLSDCNKTEKNVRDFIDSLRISGILIESGESLFSFMHRTFQEYFVAQYLLRLPLDQLQLFIQKCCHQASWHEPLQLLIAYKNMQNSPKERQEASELLHILLETSDEYDEFLHHSLILAANCVVDCSLWFDSEVQCHIANKIFDIYGDVFGGGRYTSIKQDIEKVALLWLRGQPVEANGARPPFLNAWCSALCDDSHQVRQKGAAYLLAILAPNLTTCPYSVLYILLPPLLLLADVVDIAYPPEHIRKQLSHMTAKAATPQVTEYALLALRQLEEMGPAGWLKKEWDQWNKERPELLERLMQHSLELDYLLTPVALPVGPHDKRWDQQIAVNEKWKKHAQYNMRQIQVQLLQIGTTARFPHAWLLKKLLISECASSAQNTPWQVTWNRELQKEMALGKSVTYQPCLDLRLLLYPGDEQHHRAIAMELQNALPLRDHKRPQVLNSIINIHLLDIRYLLDIQYLLDFRDLRYLLDFQNLLDFQYLRDLLDFQYLRDLLDFRYLRYLRNLRDIFDLRYLRYLRDLRGLRDLLDLRDTRDIRYVNKFQDIKDFRSFRDFKSIRSFDSFLDYGVVFRELCIALEQDNEHTSTILLCIYSIIRSKNDTLIQHKQEIQRCLQQFTQPKRQRLLLASEQRFLISLIKQVLTSVIIANNTKTHVHCIHTNKRTQWILTLQQQSSSLQEKDITELLDACTDMTETMGETWSQLSREGVISSFKNPCKVGNLAWIHLSKRWRMDKDARNVVINAIDDKNAVICAAASLLLRKNECFTLDERKNAARKIMKILRDEGLSQRPLDPPDTSKIWRLDDVLFETLQALRSDS